MRYTTERFGETIYLLGEFGQDRVLGEVTIAIYDLSNPGSPITLDDDNCVEIIGSQAGGFATYTWPSSNISEPSLVSVQYLYIMSDVVTGRVQKGKFTVGGFPDDSARSRYHEHVHISPDGTALTPIGTMAGFPTLTFTAGSPTATITRGTGSWITDGFVTGDYVQIAGANLNNGVSGPITNVTALTLTLTNGMNPIQTDTQTGTEEIVSKNFEFALGTLETPVDGLLDANLIAQVLGLNTYHLADGMTMTVTFSHDNWIFEGEDPDADIVTFNGNSTAGCSFTTIGVRGDLNGRIVATRSIIGSDATATNDIQGVFNDCGFAGSMVLAAGGTFSGLGIAARNLLGVTVNFTNGSSPSFLVGAVYGIWNIINMTGGSICGMALIGAIVTFANSCTGGTANLGGVGEVVLQANVATSITDNVVKGSRLDEAVSNVIPFVA